jgi:YD repeat-containing protein
MLDLEHYKGTNQLSSVRYGLDAVGNRTSASESVACGSGAITRNITYGYDALDRVTGASYSDATPTENYVYDAAGNRTSAKLGTNTTTYDYDAANRLTGAHGPQSLAGVAAKATVCVGGLITQLDASLQLLVQGNQAYSYDANGNLLQQGGTKYAYDAADNLVRSEKPTLLLGLPLGAPDVTTFAYNGDDVRVSRNNGGRLCGGRRYPHRCRRGRRTRSGKPRLSTRKITARRDTQRQPEKAVWKARLPEFPALAVDLRKLAGEARSPSMVPTIPLDALGVCHIFRPTLGRRAQRAAARHFSAYRSPRSSRSDVVLWYL